MKRLILSAVLAIGLQAQAETVPLQYDEDTFLARLLDPALLFSDWCASNNIATLDDVNGITNEGPYIDVDLTTDKISSTGVADLASFNSSQTWLASVGSTAVTARALFVLPGLNMSITTNASGGTNFIVSLNIINKTESQTIDSGDITITAGTTFLTADTESGGVTDNLDNIFGGTDGQILVIKCVSAFRNVVLRNSIGNIRLRANRTLTAPGNRVLLWWDATAGFWYETDGWY